jgi:DhnA family fructose-bisphosphate aldolase class Ia
MDGREIRFERLFSGRKNAVIIAVDHGEFDGPIPGMIDLPETVRKINPMVDGVLLSPGMLRHCGHVFNRKGAPMAVVRLNWSTVYCFHWEYERAVTVPAFSARDAVALGADIALVSLTLRTGSEEQDARNVECFRRLASEARSVGLPVVGEFFPARTNKITPDELHQQVKIGSRVLAELGADMIKTFFTNKFREVVEGCPAPILGLGAEKTPTQLQALRLAQSEVREGARGVVFGRNAIQVADPFKFQAALCEVVKDGADPDACIAKYGLKD